MDSLRCIAGEAGSKSLQQRSLLKHVTRQHNNKFNAYGVTTRVHEGWSMIWFIKCTGERHSRVVSSLCITAAVGASLCQISLLKYVPRCHKTILNEFGMTARHHEGWSTIWFIEHYGQGESRVVSSWCNGGGKPLGNRFDKDPYLSM